MNESPDRTGPPRSGAPTYKSKNAVQRSVTALLDELAPERVVRRIDHLPGPVEQHRTPNGCVLQASDCAVSVSWFAEDAKDSSLGEMHVIVWRGIVARRGATSQKKGATIATELILLPIEPPANDCLWQGPEGTQYDTASLAAKVLALLQEQVDLPK
jgi:hypothetical protein